MFYGTFSLFKKYAVIHIYVEKQRPVKLEFKWLFSYPFLFWQYSKRKLAKKKKNPQNTTTTTKNPTTTTKNQTPKHSSVDIKILSSLILFRTMRTHLSLLLLVFALCELTRLATGYCRNHCDTKNWGTGTKPCTIKYTETGYFTRGCGWLWRNRCVTGRSEVNSHPTSLH